jgi:hypothetical protein
MKSRWFRWTIRILLGCIALVGVAFAALFIKDPIAARLLLAMLVYPLFGNTSPPAMLKADVTGMWLKWDEASRKLTSHLQREFPIGTAETKLKSALLKQGFKPLPPPPSDCVPAGRELPPGRVYTSCPTRDLSMELVYRWGSPICTDSITVRWATDPADAITEISAGYYAACL